MVTRRVWDGVSFSHSHLKRFSKIPSPSQTCGEMGPIPRILFNISYPISRSTRPRGTRPLVRRTQYRQRGRGSSRSRHRQTPTRIQRRCSLKDLSNRLPNYSLLLLFSSFLGGVFFYLMLNKTFVLIRLRWRFFFFTSC